MPVLKDRLFERLDALGQIGITAEGGVTRLAYTPEYRKALLRKIMINIGVTREKGREYISIALGDEE